MILVSTSITEDIKQNAKAEKTGIHGLLLTRWKQKNILQAVLKAENFYCVNL